MKTKILLLFLFFVSCAHADYQCTQCVVITPAPTLTATPTRMPTPVATARVINFTESQDIFANPGIGFQTTRKTSAQVSNPRNIPLLHATFRTCMNQLNPSAGVFDWSEIDSFLTAANAQGQTVQLGVIAYDPYDCGGWLKNNIPSVQVFCSTENPGRAYYAPDWNTVAAQGAHRAFLQAFAAKYNSDARVDSVDVRSIGVFGAWQHSCFNNKTTGQPHPMPTEAARRAIIKDYHDFFTNKPLIHVLDDTISRQEAVTRGAGWRADCWGGHHEDDLYPGWLVVPMDMSQLWEHARVDLEPCEGLTSTSYMSLVRKVDEAIEKHASAINTKNDIAFSDTQWPEWGRLLRKLGYRFVLRSARIQNGTTLTIENVGIAPNYTPLDIRFGNETKSLSKVLPGTIVQVSFVATVGTVTFSMGNRAVRTANVEWNNGININ